MGLTEDGHLGTMGAMGLEVLLSLGGRMDPLGHRTGVGIMEWRMVGIMGEGILVRRNVAGGEGRRCRFLEFFLWFLCALDG